jgi:phosphonate ABC transporter permease subunit PhnE
MMKEKPSLLKSLGIGLAAILVVVIYAYGVTITKVDFETSRSERRMASLSRILRALAHPDLFTYNYDETDLDLDFYLPCPEGGLEETTIDRTGPFISANVYCAEPGDTIVVEGYNLQPRSRGPINFIGYNPDYDQGIEIQIGDFTVEEDGTFSEEVQLPFRRPVEQAQTIRATGRVRVGAPMISDSARITWDKIVETVFLALLATTVGTLISIPVSFFAARNLMSEVKSPLSSIALSLIGWPLGIFLGLKATQFIIEQSEQLLTSSFGIELAGVVIGSVIVYLLIRQRVVQGTETTDWIAKIIQLLITILMILFAVVTLFLFGKILLQVGSAIIEPLGWFGFFGNFIYVIGDISIMFIPAIGALAIGGVFGGLLGQIGQTISDKMDANVAKVINFFISPASFALLAVIIMRGVNWFYQFANPRVYGLYPAVIGLAIGLLLAIVYAPDRPLPTGMVIYTIARTLMNGTRSVEPLIMAIVFVVWVGLGPFAGSLALGLHTIAALSKLFSEQVESILPGPLEAVKATGANRLQTIVFAVVPQIIPPYISFTMYRWDINVRMSTIIGFVGGGGIGFVLQQNINLLQYRAAATNMLAIAIVVATMDYVSSAMRERFV